MSFWASSGGTVPLEHLVDLAFGALASGLPEQCDLRHVTENSMETVTPNNVAEERKTPDGLGIRHPRGRQRPGARRRHGVCPTSTTAASC